MNQRVMITFLTPRAVETRFANLSRKELLLRRRQGRAPLPIQIGGCLMYSEDECAFYDRQASLLAQAVAAAVRTEVSHARRTNVERYKTDPRVNYPRKVR